MAANPVLHACINLVEVDYHFVRNLVADDNLNVLVVRSNE